jgi:hypothetical protein
MIGLFIFYKDFRILGELECCHRKAPFPPSEHHGQQQAGRKVD